MAMDKISAKLRSEKGTNPCKRLRRAGRIPGIVYGKDTEPTQITVDRADFHRLIRHHGESSLISLEIEGERTDHEMAIYKNVQIDALNTKVLHIDFQAVRAGEKVSITVPVVLTGTPVGVRDQGGVLMQARNEVTITCIPKLIPEQLEIDISTLELHQSIHLGELPLAEGIELEDNPKISLVSIIETRAVAAESTEEGEGAEGEVAAAKPAEGAAAAKPEEKA